MKYSEYSQHLGFFRHFALCRGLYDRTKALEDQLRAKDASHAVKVKSMEATIAGLMETIARKNGYTPIQPEPRKEFVPTKPTPKSTDAMAFRQSQVDAEAQKAAREVEKERSRAFADEARGIIDAGMVKQ